jgi:hypothetical protein
MQTLMETAPADRAEAAALPGWRRFAKRILQVGFLFFLAKGMVWLVLGWLAWRAV